MLLQLTVQNFALIEKTNIRFGPHFNVLSGETGVGKSILIDAVKLLLGGRANTLDIRYGTDAALVEGVFDWPADNAFQTIADEFGLLYENGDPLILSRELRQNGRNTCRINGRVVTLGQYRQLSQPLISIFGQHDHQHMSDPGVQLRFIDRADEGHVQDQLLRVQATYQKAQQSGRRYKRLVKKKQQEETAMASLKKELAELDKHQLVEGEEHTLRTLHSQLAHVDTLNQQLLTAHHALYGADASAYAAASVAAEAVQKVVGLHQDITPLHTQLDVLQITIQELAFELEALRNALPMDPGELVRIEDRLALFDRLTRRYGKDMDELIRWCREGETRLHDFDQLDVDLTAFQEQYRSERAEYQKEALALRALRKDAARSLSEDILHELRDLAMEKVRFEIAFSETSGDATGMDQVTFLFSTNPGMPLMPVTDIASGGEMSRIMLALQTVLGKSESTTLIFDEIDTGIGGMVLGKVAEKLALVSQKHQVICVTHAPAIAALADDLFTVKKIVSDDTTRTAITHIREEDALRKELARMLGGYDAWHVEHADQLREKRRSIKKTLRER